MTRDDFLDKQYEIAVAAGMNQRYHQHLATYWWRWDASAKIATAILAVMGAMIAVGCIFHGHPEWLDIAGVVVASAAAIAAVILNVVPFGTWEQEHRDFLSQWTDLREDVEGLAFEVAETPADHHVAELRKLDAKLHRLSGIEPSPDQALLDRCYQSEKKSRTPPATQEAEPPAAAATR